MELSQLPTRKQVISMTIQKRIPSRVMKKTGVERGKTLMSRATLQTMKRSNRLIARDVLIKKLINSMTLDDLLEVTRLSTQRLHGEEVSLTQATPQMKRCYKKIAKASNAASAKKLVNLMNTRIVELNNKAYAPSPQSLELYEKFMKE